MKTKKRKVDLLVLSDIHLGTFGCRAKELLNYLKTINPKKVILNGDIIDIWQFNKRYFPGSHMKVIKYLSTLLHRGVSVHYITGNHDEMLRKFKGFKLGSFEIVNKLVLNLNGKKTGFFHGDVFDVFMKNAKWIAKLGGIGYDILIVINSVINWISQILGYERISFSKKIKDSVKGAVSHINNFQETVADLASYNGYDNVVCGHIHYPLIKEVISSSGKKVLYLNSGDWIENLSALEYNKGEWRIYRYEEDTIAKNNKSDSIQEEELAKVEFKNKQLYMELIEEFQVI